MQNSSSTAYPFPDIPALPQTCKVCKSEWLKYIKLCTFFLMFVFVAIAFLSSSWLNIYISRTYLKLSYRNSTRIFSKLHSLDHFFTFLLMIGYSFYKIFFWSITILALSYLLSVIDIKGMKVLLCLFSMVDTRKFVNAFIVLISLPTYYT